MLEGIRVIDMTHHMAGPFCTQKLGDMGADVIKVEPPAGEWTRRAINDQQIGDLSTAFCTVNRSKRGLAVDLKSPEGLAIMHDLVQTADVFVVNMRPGAVARLGLDYDRLTQLNPRLIHMSITGFGEEGPLAGRPGQDLLAQAFTGVTWNAGRRSDPPIPAGTPFVDVATSYLATIGILAALVHRDRTGLGQKLSANLLESAMDVQATEIMGYLNNGQILDRAEYWSGHPTGTAPYGIHPTKDGYIAIAFGPYGGFADALEVDELRRFTQWDDGYTHRDEIYGLVVPRLLERTTQEWIDRFDAHGVWCGRVNTYADLFEEPHVVANGIVEEVRSNVRPPIRHTRFPVRFGLDQPRARSHPPLVGEDTDDILRELGRTDDDIADMRSAGVVR